MPYNIGNSPLELNASPHYTWSAQTLTSPYKGEYFGGSGNPFNLTKTSNVYDAVSFTNNTLLIVDTNRKFMYLPYCVENHPVLSTTGTATSNHGYPCIGVNIKDLNWANRYAVLEGIACVSYSSSYRFTSQDKIEYWLERIRITNPSEYAYYNATSSSWVSSKTINTMYLNNTFSVNLSSINLYRYYLRIKTTINGIASIVTSVVFSIGTGLSYYVARIAEDNFWQGLPFTPLTPYASQSFHIINNEANRPTTLPMFGVWGNKTL